MRRRAISVPCRLRVAARGLAPMRIVGLDVLDLRFPTSRTHDGTDAVHVDPDYSAAYVILRTDAGLEGHGLTFTIGRGQRDLRRGDRRVPPPRRRVDAGRRDLRLCRLLAPACVRFAAALAGPRKRRDPPGAGRRRQRGLGSVREGRAEAGLEAARRHDAAAGRFVHRLPLHHRRAHAGRSARAARAAGSQQGARARRALLRDGYPAYTTSVGWMGYSDEKIRSRCAARRSATASRISRSRSAADSGRRSRAASRLVREAIGPDRKLMIDANQQWDVDEAIARVTDAGALQPVVDRGADQPGRRARATPRSRARCGRWASASRPASTARTGSSSSSCCRPTRSTSARSTAAGSAA